MERRESRAARARGRTVPKQSKLKRWLITGSVIGVIAVIVLLAVLSQLDNEGGITRGSVSQRFTVEEIGTELPPREEGATLPGERIPEEVAEHVLVGRRVTYNSNPPTSGKHYGQTAIWGIYDSAPSDEYLVHNLEHGGIIISYNPDRIDDETLEQLHEQARDLATINPRLIVTPRENMDAAIALTAWGYLQKLESYDPAAIQTFYNAHIARGPECQNGLCPQ